MMYNTSMRLVLTTFLTISKFEVAIFALAAFVCLVFLCFFFGVSNHKQSQHQKEIKELSNSTRAFIVDVKNDKVNYFNSAHLHNRRALSITAFYNQYEPKDREKIIHWVGDLLDQNTQTPKFMETKVYIKSLKALVSTILEVQKIEFEKKLIFIESHLLQTDLEAHRKGEKVSFSKRDYLNKKILMSNGRGATLYFNFYNQVTKTSDISQLAYADLRDIILTFASEKVLIVEQEFGQIIVTNFDLKNKAEILTFANEITTKVNRYLSIKSYSNDIHLAIGIIENEESFRDANNLIKNVIAVSNMCKDNDQLLGFYSENKALLTEEKGDEYKNDVQTIIEENKISYFFQPIFNVERGKVTAYKATFQPKDEFFTSIDMLKSYAARTQEEKELFSTIARNTFAQFVQERDDSHTKLLFPISYNELAYASRTLGRISGAGSVNLVLTLKEKDLSALPTDYEEETIVDAILSLKSKGYSVALEIDDDILTLTPRLYEVFDYFNLSVNTHIQKKNASKNLPTFQGLIEKLLHYNKTILAYDIQSWDIVELVYKLGISAICSDAIALPAENILPLQKKILTKMINLKS